MIFNKKRMKRVFFLLTFLWVITTIFLGNTYLNRQYLSSNHSYLKLEENEDILKLSGTYTNITIDDSPGSPNNWAWAQTQPWCSGSGTQLDPYLIRGHNLKMYRRADGIRIINSNSSYFTIRNCNITFDTSKSNSIVMAGIFLSNTTKGQIINNTIYHLSKGIHLNNTSYIQIVNNTIYDHPQEGILSENCDFIDIIENEIFDINFYGVMVYNTTNGQIIHNNFSFNGWDGFAIENCSNLAISNNVAHNNSDNGFNIDNSTQISFTENVAYFNDIGIRIDDMSYSNFTENTVYNNILSEWGDGVKFADDCIFINFSENNIFNNTGDGIDVEDRSNNNTISNNDVYNNADNGIEIDDFCINNSVFGNEIYKNSGNGLYVANSSFQNIFENRISNNDGSGIFLDDNCNNNDIVGNIANDNGDSGIYLRIECVNNNISGNIVNNNGDSGISMEELCNKNVISGNTANNNTNNGIYLYDYSGYNTISNNFVNSTGYYGISLHWYSQNNTILNNIATYNEEIGIEIYDYSSNNTILNNVVSYNGLNGIGIFDFSNNNTLTENILYNNTIGVNIDNGDNNSIYENFFLKNVKHAFDDGIDNKWNITTIGNYWDNWTGPDVNPNDGIVDHPYNISGTAGTKDYLPIAEDGAPLITITSPTTNGTFGVDAPSFDVTITDDYLISMWYTIDGGLSNYTFTADGIIDQSAWDSISDGGMTLQFYASDIPGYIGTAGVSILKDATAPIIVINSPTEGDEFGKNGPPFNITVTDDHLDSIWYSYDGGITTYAIGINAPFNQTAWTVLPEGDVTITFYANDTLGNEASESVGVIKSISADGPDMGVIMIIVASILGGVAVVSVVYVFIKKRAAPA